MSEITTHHRACHLCEAICGLEIKTQGEEIVSIKGDKNDPLSHGFICPKATALADLHKDPERIREPRIRKNNGWETVSWDEALQFSAEKLVNLQVKYGNDALAFYAGNPGVHNYGNLTHGTQLRRVLKTRNHYSATSLDQLPHQLAGYLMYGHQFFIPIADIDHTDFMLILGGNPIASNGSMMTMPNAPKRLRAIRQRGGKLVVIDPRRTETAEIADQHCFIRPGSDAYLLMAMINHLLQTGQTQKTHVLKYVEGLDKVKQAVQPFTLQLAERQTGIDAQTIRQLAEQLANTPKAVVYGRMGVSVQSFGALCQWAIQVLNILIGALDVRGGALLSSPAFASVRKGTPAAGHFDRFRSRVRGLPEFAGELPTSVLAEEILTPGDGQIKGMVTIAGNPVISSSNAGQLDQAFKQMEFYLAIDIYVNATTRHADVILPPTSPLEHDHYDIAFHRLAVHNSARYNPAIFPRPQGALHDWEIFNELTGRISKLQGKSYQALPAPDKIVDAGIRADMYGTGQDPLTMDKLKTCPHGIDLGPLQPGLTKRIATESGTIDAAPQIYLQDLPRLLAQAENIPGDKLLLIGRRHIRSNNSWMHNYHRLVKGKPRWQLMMHPDDLTKYGLRDNAEVTIESRTGQVTTTVIATDEVMPGVVSLPHGWGHHYDGMEMSLASQQAGVNCNILTDDQFVDKLSGNAALNGVPVTVRAA